jgi:hypothetical protein
LPHDAIEGDSLGARVQESPNPILVVVIQEWIPYSPQVDDQDLDVFMDVTIGGIEALLDRNVRDKDRSQPDEEE